MYIHVKVCAAASLMLETLPDDVEAAEGDQLASGGGSRDGSGGGGGGDASGGGGGEGAGGGGLDDAPVAEGDVGGGGAGAVNWQLSPAALARVNARLPQEVR